MGNHVFFERLYEKSSPSKGLLTPFNIDAIEDVDTSDSYFESTLYKKALPVSSQNTINPMHIIERGITRLAMDSVIPDLTGFGGFGFDSKDNFYCDYYDGTQVSFNEAIKRGETDFKAERHIILGIEAGTSVLKGTVVDEYGGETPYLIKTRTENGANRHSASAAIYAVLAYIIASHEKGMITPVSELMYKHYKDIGEGYSSADMATFMKAIVALDVDCYTLLKYPGEVATKVGALPIDPAGFDRADLDPVNIAEIEELTAMTGDSKILRGNKVTAFATVLKGKKKVRTIKDLISDDSFSLGMSLSKEEELLIPKGFDNFVPSDITLDVAQEIKASSLDPIAARNFMWTGETGTGKSTESQMLAVLLHIPYRSMNLSSDKLSCDILQSCLPNNSKASKAEIEALIKSFPDSETIAINPDMAYEMITGIKKSGVTEDEINKAKCNSLMRLVNKASDFMYVDSPFVESFRKGGVIELQEVNSCKAAILKSLNEALDDLNIIHLPTGEIVRRHPNCVVVVTANVGQGYEGINNFSNDFIARFHQADVFELPDDETLIKRVKDRSGYADEKVIKKMIRVMRSIQRVLLETKGDYGSCSPRGLISWARKTKNSGNAYLAGCKTIVGLSTQDPEIRIELLHALETEFSPM